MSFEAAASGRARWNIENGNNTTLKSKGYCLEHNFGHGEGNLSNVPVALNILAFLLHTYLAAADGAYRLVRTALPTRKTFFEHLRALTAYICFPSWPALLDFMMRGLEVGPTSPRPSRRSAAAGRERRDERHGGTVPWRHGGGETHAVGTPEPRKQAQCRPAGRGPWKNPDGLSPADRLSASRRTGNAPATPSQTARSSSGGARNGHN